MPLKTHLDEQPTLNLTPMIDIVFLLIIFFMVGMKFTELERNITLQVPEVSNVSALSSAPEKKIINVFQDGRISLNRKVVTISELTQQLSAAVGEYKDLGVIVRGDAAGPFQNVAGVLNACKEAGVEEMGVSVKLSDGQQ